MRERLKRYWNKAKTLFMVRSLRIRIFLLLVIVGIFPSVLMRYGIVTNYEKRAVSNRIAVVQNQLKILANHLVSNNYLKRYVPADQEAQTPRDVINAELEMLSNLYEGRVMIIDAGLCVIKDTYGVSEGKIIISEEVIECFKGRSGSRYDPEHGYIEMTTPITDTVSKSQGKEEKEILGVMLTCISNESIVATKELLNNKSMILEFIMIMIIVTAAFLLSGILVKPFIRVKEAINEVKAGYSNECISVPDYVETVHIVDAFNQVLGRMRTLDESRQDFVANVSHELKTPMTSIKVLADSLLTQDHASVELYREFMGDIVSEIDRENRIITDLLALVRMDKKANEMDIVSLNINELAEIILKRLRPIARKKDVEMVFESIRPVTAEVDEVKMSLVMTNLVENAIKYNKEHGRVKVVLDADHQSFTFTVSDTGIGIPQEALSHIYERFYRVDKSHSRQIGGTGLGLSIARNAVLMHRGSIHVESVEGEGTTFVVKIPLNHIAQ